MKRLLILFAVLCTGFFNPAREASSKFVRMDGASKIYAERKATPLNETELKVVGMWAGENREVKWEILRHANGTYELVVYEDYEGEIYNEFYKGIWGIEDDRYFYQDLESSDQEAFFGGYRTYENVIEVTEDTFHTKGEGSDGEPLTSVEKKVESFQMKLWDEYGSEAVKR